MGLFGGLFTSHNKNKQKLWHDRQRLLDQKLAKLELDGYVITKPENMGDRVGDRGWENHPMNVVNIYDAFHNNKTISLVEYSVEEDYDYFEANYRSGPLAEPQIEIFPPARIVDLVHPNDGELPYFVSVSVKNNEAFRHPLAVEYCESSLTFIVATKSVSIGGEKQIDPPFSFERGQVDELIKDAFQKQQTIELICVVVHQAWTPQGMPSDPGGFTRKVKVESLESQGFTASDIGDKGCQNFVLDPSSQKAHFTYVIGCRQVNILTTDTASNQPNSVNSNRTGIEREEFRSPYRTVGASYKYRLRPSIEKTILSELIDYCRTELPNMACGFLSGKDFYMTGFHKIPNLTPSQYRFQMDSEAQASALEEIYSSGEEPVAIFSSRPNGSTYPSETDVRMAVESGCTNLHYVYVGFRAEESPDVAFYWIDSSGRVELAESTVTNRLSNRLAEISKSGGIISSPPLQEQQVLKEQELQEALRREEESVNQREQEAKETRRKKRIKAASKYLNEKPSIAKKIGVALLDRISIQIEYVGDDPFYGHVDVYATKNLFYEDARDASLTYINPTNGEIDSREHFDVDTQDGFEERGELECYDHRSEMFRVFEILFIKKVKFASNIFLERPNYEPSEGFTKTRYQADLINDETNTFLSYQFTFRDFVNVLKSEGAPVRPGGLFDDNRQPNHISGHIAKRLLGLTSDERSLNISSTSRLTSFQVLQKAFGFSGRYARLISISNDGPIWEAGSPLDRLENLFEVFPRIGDTQFLLDDIPKEMENYFAKKKASTNEPSASVAVLDRGFFLADELKLNDEVRASLKDTLSKSEDWNHSCELFGEAVRVLIANLEWNLDVSYQYWGELEDIVTNFVLNGLKSASGERFLTYDNYWTTISDDLETDISLNVIARMNSMNLDFEIPDEFFPEAINILTMENLLSVFFEEDELFNLTRTWDNAVEIISERFVEHTLLYFPPLSVDSILNHEPLSNWFNNLLDDSDFENLGDEDAKDAALAEAERSLEPHNRSEIHSLEPLRIFERRIAEISPSICANLKEIIESSQGLRGATMYLNEKPFHLGDI